MSLTLLGGAVIDMAGNPNAQSIAPIQPIDTKVPAVSAFAPADDAVTVPVASNIVVTFSEAVQRGTGSIVLKTAAGTVVATYDAATSANLSISGSTLTLNPSADLGYSTGYEVEFASGSIKDLAGNNYAGTTSYGFTTNFLGDTVAGNAANERFVSTLGDDFFDGGAGTDLVVFSGAKSGYVVLRSGASVNVSGPDGNDSLLNIERMEFSDFHVAFDTAGNAGQAYRLYQAAFNRTPDIPGLGFQMKALDDGWGITAIAQNFIDSPEFSATYGALDDAQFVTQLYANVLHRAPDEDGLAYHVERLHTVPRSFVLVGFSESPENQAAVIGVIENGMVYTV